MNSVRDAVLLGTRGAVETHATLSIRQRTEQTSGPVDVFGTIEELGLTLLFKPLHDLLGFSLRLPGAVAGIQATTRRDLHMQRFTAAHELGHVVLEHEGSLDREIGLPGQTANRDLREVAADTFAAEFLMPRWLLIHHAKRHSWTAKQLTDPAVTYQLSLRIAMSYEATCLALLSNKILDAKAVKLLREQTPKRIKQRALPGVQLDDPWADVWVLDQQDHGATIEAGPRDLFVARLPERAGSGYLWETRSLETAGFELIENLSQAEDPQAIGSPAIRRLVFRSAPPGTYRLSLSELRPWETNASPLAKINLGISTLGAEPGVLLRRSRPAPGAWLVH